MKTKKSLRKVHNVILSRPVLLELFHHSGVLELSGVQGGDLFKTISAYREVTQTRFLKTRNISALRIININSEESRITLELVDKSENSLKWITGYIEIVFRILGNN